MDGQHASLVWYIMQMYYVVLIMDVDYQIETLFHVQEHNDVEEQVYFYNPEKYF
jgi:hypothetical protein